MPFGPYKDFEDCLEKQMASGNDKEAAQKICGALQAKLEKNSEFGKKYRFIQKLGEDIDINKEFELITTAKQTDSRYGDFRYTKADLDEMAQNFNSDIVGTDIAVDLNHDPEGIALAWIVPGSMSVKPSSKISGEYSLYAKLHKFTPKGEKLIKTGAVKYFSIEIQHKFEKFVGEIKKTFKNVIRGLALTNRPVIKDMMPTFSEIIKLSTNMKAFNVFLSELKSKKIVSLTEKELLKKMYAELSDEEQEDVKADVDEVGEKPEEEHKKEEPKKGEPKGDDENDDKDDDDDDDKDGEKLSDVKKKLSETKSKADRALTELRRRDCQDIAKNMVLSESGEGIGYGIQEKDVKDVVNFMMTLSENQLKAFSEIYKQIKTVDFSERGKSGSGSKNVESGYRKFAHNGEEVDPESEELDAKIKAYSEKHKVSYEEAFDKVTQ